MTKPGIHLCLVSDQLIANYLPAHMLKAERAVLLCTEEMHDSPRPHWLAEALRKDGIAVDLWPKPCPTGPLPFIEEYARQVAREIQGQWPEHQLVMNLTGGTKLMAIGFDRGLLSHGRASVYLDTQHNRLEQIGDGHVRQIPLEGHTLEAETYFLLQGLQIRAGSKGANSFSEAWRLAATARTVLTCFLGKNHTRLRSAIKRLAMFPGQHPEWTPLENHRVQNKFATLGLHTGVLEQTGQSFRCSVAGDKYLNGGWVEEWAWLALEQARPDWAGSGVHLHYMDMTPGSLRPHGTLTNEFDGLAVHGGRALFVECKQVRNMAGVPRSKPDKLSGAALNDIILKGNRVTGPFGARLLVSTDLPSADALLRATANGLVWLYGEHLKDLPCYVTTWVTKGKLPPSPALAMPPAP